MQCTCLTLRIVTKVWRLYSINARTPRIFFGDWKYALVLARGFSVVFLLFFFLKKSSNELQRVDLVRIVVYSWLNCFSDFLPFRADIANVSFCFGLFGRWCCLLLVLFFFYFGNIDFFLFTSILLGSCVFDVLKSITSRSN